MKKIFLLLLFVPVISQGQLIETFAGNGSPGFSGDGGPATAAKMNITGGIVFDGYGNAYISDYYNNRIRKVSTTGIITTYAGSGGIGHTGDGGSALAATLNGPTNLAIDGAGNLYVADLMNHSVRKITPGGIISTFAGNGSLGNSGDGGPATNAEMYKASGLAIDNAGNVYIADYGNNVIRMVNTAGIITTVVGTGYPGSSGDGGLAIDATLFQAWGVCFDGAENLYIAAASNHNIRKVNTSGIISTICGTGVPGFSGDGGPATAAKLNNPPGVAVDVSGNIYIADQFNNRIRQISPSGIINTIAGTGVAGYNGDGIDATSAQLNLSNSLTLDHAGNLYIVDNVNNRIRTIGAGCGNYFTSQPQNDTVLSGNDASFSVATTMATPIFQWQADAGSGFVNLSNGTTYTGVNSDTLKIINADYSLNGNFYRCIVTSEASACTNTSISAILIVINKEGVNELQNNLLNIYPDPAHDLLTISIPANTSAGNVQLFNELGQQITDQKIAGSTTQLNVSQLPAGMYILRVSIGDKIVVKKVFKD